MAGATITGAVVASHTIGGAVARQEMDILADAAHLMLTKPAREFSGNFIIDDTFLHAHGVTDFEKYRVDPTQKLFPDFFVPDEGYPVPPGVQEALADMMIGD